MKHIKGLHDNEKSTQDMRDFLNFIRDRMLVVKVKDRADAREVRDFLRNLQSNAGGGSIGL